MVFFIAFPIVVGVLAGSCPPALARANQRMKRRRREEERVRRPLRERSTGRSGKTKTGVSARRRVLASAIA